MARSLSAESRARTLTILPVIALLALLPAPCRAQMPDDWFPSDLTCSLVVDAADTLLLHVYQVWEGRDSALQVSLGISTWVSVNWTKSTIVVEEETLIGGFANALVIWRQVRSMSAGDEIGMLVRFRAELTRGRDGEKWIGYCQSSYALAVAEAATKAWRKLTRD